MTFFYDLNKKLKDVLDAPKSVNQQLNERDMSRAAKGYEKYGKEGMEALAKAGREGKALEPIRAKYNKYDESVEEGSTGDYSAKKARAGKDIGKPGKQFSKIAKSAGERYGSKERGEKVAGAVLAKLRGKNEGVEEGMFDSLKQGMKKVAKKGLEKLGHGSDEQMRADLQRKMGLPPTGKKPQTIAFHKSNTVDDNAVVGKVKEEYGPLESAGGTPMTPKQKKFAKLAPPADKITFADKIAGAKKEVDEMLGDVAAEAMRKAVKGKKVVADEGWDDMIKDVEKRRQGMKTGEKIQGHKGEIEKTATGIKHTRKYDPKTGETDSGEEGDAQTVKRGRGRPKKTDRAPERVTAKAYKHKGGRVAEQGEEELDEKAVSKKQQRFMGMVHAAQKGEKPASKEVAKVAKSMKKKDAEDFASTKHKGLPEKVKSKKSEGKKEKTEEAGGSGTPTASSGFSFGKGIYDSLNREIENLIAESMSINASDSTEGGKSLTITATDDDALRLAEIVRNAGIGGEGVPHAEPEGEVEVVGIQSPISGDEGHEHEEGECPTCGSHDCGCGDIDEALAENEPEWPTDEVESDDAMQYSGGLNGPKSTGQTTVPVIAHQDSRMGVDGDDELRRMMEMAGLQSELKPWERTMKEEAEDWTVDINQRVPNTPQFSINRYLKDPTIAQYGMNSLSGFLKNYGDDEAKLADLVKRHTLPSERDREFKRMQNLVNFYKQRDAASMASYKARTDAENAEKAKQQQQQQKIDATLDTAKKGISGMYEQEQVMAVESAEEELDEAKEMCDVCEATPCKCDESVEESIARFRSLAGIQEAAKPDFLDVDKDGDKKESFKKAEKDKEDKKVEESILSMTNLWKAYKG